MKISDHVRGRSQFQYYREGNLYYKTLDTNFNFVIPISDTDKASFENEDKSLFFMRWIMKQFEVNEQLEYYNARSNHKQR